MINLIKSIVSSIWTFVADFWGIFRAHPGMLAMIAAFLALLAWSNHKELERTCVDLQGVFRNQRTGERLTFDQSVALLERLPSLRSAVDRCHIEIGH